jgi:DNA-binding NarL/FixJ family response regulator
MTKLLLLENDAFAANFMKATLSQFGFTSINIAATASDAMKLFQQLKPDVCLLDIEIGNGPNGIDVARAMRRLNPTVGIVFLTSVQDPRLIDLKGLDLPTGSYYMAKSSVGEPQDIAHALQDSISAAKSDAACEIRTSVPALNLSSGQYELIRFIAEGLSNKEIASRKVVTVKSAENSIARLAKKLDIQDLTANSQRVLIAKKYFELIGKV